MTTYPDSVRFLYSLGNEIRTVKLGLERMRTLLAGLGNPERACRFVHVAGTNGKGSVCAMTEAGLRAAGFRTGLFTSPHLVEPTERIQVNGQHVSEERFAEAFDRVHLAAEDLLRREELDCHPTYFETVTAMAFLLFRDLGVAMAVLEVGLGGRLDATNVVSPEVTAITSIDFDHEKYLGNSLQSIAGEKAGILKAGVPAVFSRQRPDVMAYLEQRAAEVGAPVVKPEEWHIERVEIHQHGHRLAAMGPRGPVRVECPLAGQHQVDNALTAIAILATIGVAGLDIERGIPDVCWPGRLETVSMAPEMVLDGAHNPAGIRALAAYIERFYSGRRIWLIHGTMRDKSLDEIAGVLTPLADRIILTRPNSDRALRPESLKGFFDHPRLETAPTVADALGRAREAPAYVAVFVTGSLHLVGEARKLLRADCVCTR